MRISPIGYLRRCLSIAAIATAGLTVSAPVTNAQAQTTEKDVYSSVHSKVSPGGTQDSFVLKNAPSPEFALQGKKNKAAIVVDLSQNVLYQYDEKGNAVEAFLVASGKKSTPTPKSMYSVLRVETYPYKSAAVSTKRRKSPKSFGPNILILGEINPKTGEKVETGIYIHGNNDYKSLGHYESKGCIRMDNQVIKKLAKQIKSGHFVLIK